MSRVFECAAVATILGHSLGAQAVRQQSASRLRSGSEIRFTIDSSASAGEVGTVIALGDSL